MATVIWNRKGVLMVGFMQKKDHNNVIHLYCETRKKLHRVIQNKRHGMLTYGVVLLHDNAHPYTAAHSRAPLEHFNWELFDHPYSLQLAPSDYHLFTYLKNCLRSQGFNNKEELMKGVKTWLS
jgi:histone-lysine N-methyltransferase SETMAR